MNDIIDQTILGYLQREAERKSYGNPHSTLCKVIGHLQMPPPSAKCPAHWWRSELVNRSCQRLKRKGLIRYDRKRGWLCEVPTPSASPRRSATPYGAWISKGEPGYEEARYEERFERHPATNY